MSTMEVRWSGPYSLVGINGHPIIYDVPEAATGGIYLWALPIDGRHLIHYVGIARDNVAARQAEHMRHYLSGNYSIYEPKQFSQAQRSAIYQPKDGLACFLAGHRELCDSLFEQVNQLHVFFAPIAGADREMLERIESSVIEVLRQAGGRAFAFLDNMRLSRCVPTEQRMTITVYGHEKFEGMPKELRI